jgi:hypothetical protein
VAGVCVGQPSLPGGGLRLVANYSCVSPTEFVFGSYRDVAKIESPALDRIEPVAKCMTAISFVSGRCDSGVAGQQWRTLDPVAGRSKYPNPQGTYPLWVELDGVAQCLTRSGDTDGSTVSMQPCGDVSPNQVWE